MTDGQRAFVTGGSGFIGSHLVGHLQAAGWRVAMLSRTDLPALFEEGNPRVARFGYTGKTEEVCKAIDVFRPHVVFHLASLFLTQHRMEDIEALVRSNILLGTQVLEAMRLADVTHLVNAGTAWQNFAGDAYEPVNLYAATKQAFEDILAYYAATAGLKSVTLRLFDSYGPKDTRRKLLRLLLDSLKTGEAVEMSPGDQVIDLVHVEDICNAFLHAAKILMAQPAQGASVFAVSGGQRRSVREVAATLEEAAGRRLPVRFGARPHRQREVMLPWNGPSLPGWKPRITLLDGFRSLLAEEQVSEDSRRSSALGAEPIP